MRQKWPEQQDPNLELDALVGTVLQSWPEQQDPNLDLDALVGIALEQNYNQS